MPSFSARIVIQVLKLMGVKKIFAKAPMDYKKLRKSESGGRKIEENGWGCLQEATKREVEKNRGCA